MSEHETIADIIAEKRREANYIVQVSQGKCQTRRDKAEDEARDIRREADRIEAAYKRERGNCAKLREALKDAYDKLLLWNYTDGDTARMALGVMNKLDAALAAPPRNCDVGTAEEQKERFEEFCDDEKGDRQHCRNCRLCNALDCELAWAQMPYEESDNKMKNESPAKPKVLIIDDAGYMGSYAQKFLDFCDVEQEYGIPEDETVLAKYDVLIVDGEGIGNSKYKNGIEFCKAYEKQGSNKGVIYHSGLFPDKEDCEILKEKGIKVLRKGDQPGKFVEAVQKVVLEPIIRIREGVAK